MGYQRLRTIWVHSKHSIVKGLRHLGRGVSSQMRVGVCGCLEAGMAKEGMDALDVLAIVRVQDASGRVTQQVEAECPGLGALNPGLV